MSTSLGKTILGWIVFIIIVLSSLALFALSIYMFVDYSNEQNLQPYNCTILDIPECILIDNKILYKIILEVPNCANQSMVMEARNRTVTTCREYVTSLLNTTITCILQDCDIIARKEGAFLIIPITLMVGIVVSYILVCTCINKDSCCKRKSKFVNHDIIELSNKNNNNRI